jgi:2-oxoglutarate dehydrogenase E1 component
MPSALASDSLGVSHLIRAYQVNGHHAAKLDPLNLYARESFPNHPINTGDIIDGLPSYLTPSHHGFDPQKDMDRTLNFRGAHSGENKGYLEELATMKQKVTLRMVLNQLQTTYCGTLGVEYMHINDPERCNWIRERVENPRFLKYDNEKKLQIYERL